MQDDNVSLPLDGLCVPAGHLTHDDIKALPLEGLYVPAGQLVHVV